MLIGGLEQDLRARDGDDRRSCARASMPPASDAESLTRARAELKSTIDKLQRRHRRRASAYAPDSKRTLRACGATSICCAPTLRPAINASRNSSARSQPATAQIAEHLRSIEEWRGQWTDITRRMADKEAALAEARAGDDSQATELAARAEQIANLEQDLKEQIDNVHTLERELTEKIRRRLWPSASEVHSKEDASTRLQAALREREAARNRGRGAHQSAARGAGGARRLGRRPRLDDRAPRRRDPLERGRHRLHTARHRAPRQSGRR